MGNKHPLNIHYYNFFAPVFDVLSHKNLYKKSRSYAIQQLDLKPNQTILNIPCGTGQNFEYVQSHLKNTGKIIGIDLSKGMLRQAQQKIERKCWQNIQLFYEDAKNVNQEWIYKNVEKGLQFDAILCDFGLSNFDDWETVLDHLIQLLKPNGKLVVLDWYIANPKPFWRLVKWLRIGRVDLPIQEKIKEKLKNVQTNQTFAGGRIFVASGVKRF